MSLMWIPAQTTTPPFAHRSESPWHQRSDRGKNDRRIQFGRRHLVGITGPRRAKLPSKRLTLGVSWAHERKHLPTLQHRNLRNDMRRGPKTVQPNLPPLAGQFERTIANQARAQQRRCLDVGISLRNREAKLMVCDNGFRVTSVQLIAREQCSIAKVLLPGLAVSALTAGRTKPRHSDARADERAGNTFADGLHDPDDFMPRNQRQLRMRQLAIHDVKVGAADAARPDSQPHLPRRQSRFDNFREPQGLPRLIQQHGFH